MKNSPRTPSLATILSTLVAVLFGLPEVGQAAHRQPNLLVIQTDEHNFRTLGCYRALLKPDEAFVWGKDVMVETPNIDWLASNGAICTRFYATSPVCTPSRASFVSGRFPQNTGAIQNDLPLRDDVVTFAEVLRRQGYATGYAGKWHLDGPAKPGWAPPRKFGFEDNRYMFNRGHWKQLEIGDQGPQVKARNAKGQPTYAVEGADQKSFTTDFLADLTVEFIRAQQDRPFCYMVSIPDPHGPNTVRPPYDTMFDRLKFEAPRSAQVTGENLPSWAEVLPTKFNPRQMSLYFGMVKCIDDNVGKILEALRAQKQIDNTIVVFTADHGDMCGEHGRHNKGIPLEASAKIPFVIYYPGKITPGTVVPEALGTVDFKPTILGLMGVPSLGGDEGRNAAALFLPNQKPAGWKDIAFSRIGLAERGGNGWIGAFTGRHKFVVAPGAAPGLFDLQQDPQELKNLFQSPAHRETVREMARELADYCEKSREPHYASAAVRADLKWAVEGTGKYSPPKDESPARAKGKAKAKSEEEE